MDAIMDLNDSRKQYPPPSSTSKQLPLRVDPNRPLPPRNVAPATAQRQPFSPEVMQGNGVPRAGSRRRRASGMEREKSINDDFPQPAPKAPPVSFRQPYGAAHSPKNNDLPSFASRARTLPRDSLPPDSISSESELTPQYTPGNRDTSINQSIAGYSPFTQPQSEHPPQITSPVSPQQSSSSTTPKQYRAKGNQEPTTRDQGYPVAQQAKDTPSPVARSKTRRGSSGPQAQKEWAADRSPLQKLEVKLSDISKEEKRARVQEAEQALRDSGVDDRPRRSSQGASRAVARASSTLTPNHHDYDSGEQVMSEPRQSPRFLASQKPSSSRTPPSNDPSLDRKQLVPDATGQINRPGRSRLDQPSKIPVQTQSSYIPRQSSRRSSAPYTLGTPERGVRFQKEVEKNGAAIGDEDSYKPEPRRPARRSEREVSSVQDRVPEERNLGFVSDQNIMGNGSSKKVPLQQQTLYADKAQASGTHKPTSVRMGTEAVPGEALKYEKPPQTAAGIDARRKIGFGSELAGTEKASAHHGHHFSNLLHRRRSSPASEEQTGFGSRHLNEWKYAGTARLTNADFEEYSDYETDRQAWWEAAKTGNQRKPKKTRSSTGREATSYDDSDEDVHGTVPLSFLKFSDESRQSSHTPTGSGGSAQSRQYAGNDELLRNMERFKKVLKGRPGHNPNLSMSSEYSYSCSHLAEHDPAHQHHVCTPYKDKKLTKSMRSIRVRTPIVPTSFDPPLYLKCGPLLRYTGLKRDRSQAPQSRGGPYSKERETWRGSVMIVTWDADSVYEPAPTLRLFHEPMELLSAAPLNFNQSSAHSLPPEYHDPIAGLPKLSRTGTTVYVKPVDDFEPEKDYSRDEEDGGLFEETRTAVVPTSYGTPDFHPNNAAQPTSSVPEGQRRNLEQEGRFKEVKGVKLHAERGVTFWRFNLEVELLEQQTRVAYRINKAAPIGFWVPAKGKSMNIMFHSCNGFSMSIDPAKFSGPDPLWRDVLNAHQIRPFHVMIGGGDQIYNDCVMRQTTHFQRWLGIKNPHYKHEAEFTLEMRDELETFYLERYSMWFSQGLFGMANSQIPMINIWDDHDIIDGFGSYPDHFMETPVFSGLGAVAFKYYMLFQHQSVVDEVTADEPSWLLGAERGPFINEFSRSVFLSLGRQVAFLGLDCRTERMRDEILSEASYNSVFDRCRREIIEGETKHLIVLLGVPIAYPRLVWLENLLTSRAMAPVKAMGRARLLGNFLNKFDGGVEILDDLDDHWTARNHKQERNWFIQELQQLAAEKSVRVTILGGDVHLAAVGQFYSNPLLKIPKDKDNRYMVNVISSAIVNTPPPEMMGDILNRRNKVHHLDHDTDEDMIPMFNHDVDGRLRNNKRLLTRRNWCSIREYVPGSTPPPTPQVSEPSTPSDESPPPPTRFQRTMSLTRNDIKPSNLIRRLSLRGQQPASPNSPPSNEYRPSTARAPSPPRPSQADGYFSQRSHHPPTESSPPPPINGLERQSSAPLPRPGNFLRRPTNMSEKAATKGGPHDGVDFNDHINLEHGLDICLNCEVSQRDPSGATAPYRLLVPALWYEGLSDPNEVPYRRQSVFKRVGTLVKERGRRATGLAQSQGKGEWGGEQSMTESEVPSEAHSEFHSEDDMGANGGAAPPQWYPKPNPANRNNQERDAGFLGRAPSKVERMLGYGKARKEDVDSFSGSGEEDGGPAGESPRAQDEQRMSQSPAVAGKEAGKGLGYGGIEAWKDTQGGGLKRLFSRKGRE